MSQITNQNQNQQPQQQFPPLLIKAGLVFSESVPLSELFCKPKLLPIRGAALERLEALDEKIIEQRRIADVDKVTASKFGGTMSSSTSNPGLGASDLAGSAAQKNSSDFGSGGSRNGNTHNSNSNNSNSNGDGGNEGGGGGSGHNSGGALRLQQQHQRGAASPSNNNDVPLIAETFVDKIEDFSQYR